MKQMIKKSFYYSSGVGVVVAIYLVYLYFSLSGAAQPLIDYKPRLTTQIYDRDGGLLANLFHKEHRLYIKYKDIPPRMIEALLAIEDTSFFEHKGVNIDGIFRAIIKNIKAGAKVEGASTITQQLVRSALNLTRKKSYIRKIKEALLSLKIEFSLTKEQILERYMNHIYLGHGYYGFRTASLGYFHKEPSELTQKEIAMLVSLPRSPNFYNPTRNLEHSLSRANSVLLRMKQLGWIEEHNYTNAINEIPKVFNDTLTQNKAPYVVDEVIRSLSNGVDIESFKSAGYRIEVSIDLEIQQMARDALKYSYDRILARDEDLEFSQTLNGAMVVTDSSSGDVLALVGGVDYKASSYNRATQASRQLGSSIKPFIYQSAYNLGYHPLTLIPDITRTYELSREEGEEIKYDKDGKEIKKYWKPKNYEENIKGLITLQEALVHSRNLATINLVTQLGLDEVHDSLSEIGFKNVPNDLSISLGSVGATPLEVAHFYSLFSNYGTMVKPLLIKAVQNSQGKRHEFVSQKSEVMDPKQVYLGIDTLRRVVKSGTARGARVRGVELAAKTGTTNQNKDGWLCSFTPTMTIIAWFGNDDNSPMKDKETGGRVSAPAIRHLLNNMVKNRPQIKREFDIPNGVHSIRKGEDTIYFTDISKIPSQEIQNGMDEDEELNF
jgi:penicillin-binding protein 1A